jgi:membrane-associated phospholipid phosphatase
VIIWRYQPKYYWNYVVGLLILSYFGFITYVVFPAAPPWLASDRGVLTPSIAHISTSIWHALGVENFSTYYQKLSPNLVAAVPSLHSAYPFLFALIIRKIWGNRWFAISMVYPLAIWFGVVYLGEHYVIDVILGILYAWISYLLAPYGVNVLRKARIIVRTKYQQFA